MIKFEIRLKNALAVIDEYKGLEPLHHFLSNFYKRHKNMGGRDRRFCSEVVYAYFRLGNSLQATSVIDKIYVALFLFTNNTYQEIFTEKFESFYDVYNNNFKDKTYAVKLKFKEFELENIYPERLSISPKIKSNSIIESVFIQPNIFIRIAEKDNAKFIEHLIQKNIDFKLFSYTCLGFEPRVKLHEVFDDTFDFEVQDFSSQQTQNYMHVNADEHWLDCCAASGGKSLLLYEKEKSVQLTVSDVRASSLENLKKRFAKKGIANFETIVADASNNIEGLKPEMFDGIIADVPCSGSGTWARNPENLAFFDPQKINEYSVIQYSILKNIVQYLKPNKQLLYITCSVYAQENEHVIAKAIQNLNLKIITQDYIIGSSYNADTMFCTLLEKL